jgi:hypothetical protein
MKQVIVAAFVVLAASASPSLAGCGNGPSYLTQTQINTILANNFACGRSTSQNAPGWNERHGAASGSSVVEQHNAGTGDDETVGIWTTSAVSGRGRVTYAYSGGVTPVYEIAVTANGNCNSPSPGTCTSLPQTYQFCGVGGGAPAVLNILVTTSLQALTACPTNP